MLKWIIRMVMRGIYHSLEEYLLAVWDGCQSARIGHDCQSENDREGDHS